MHLTSTNQNAPVKFNTEQFENASPELFLSGGAQTFCLLSFTLTVLMLSILLQRLEIVRSVTLYVSLSFLLSCNVKDISSSHALTCHSLGDTGHNLHHFRHCVNSGVQSKLAGFSESWTSQWFICSGKCCIIHFAYGWSLMPTSECSKYFTEHLSGWSCYHDW